MIILNSSWDPNKWSYHPPAYAAILDDDQVRQWSVNSLWKTLFKDIPVFLKFGPIDILSWLSKMPILCGVLSWAL